MKRRKGTIEVRSGEEVVRGALSVIADETPALLVPDAQTETPGTPIRFDVLTDGQQPHSLSVSGLPAGATFNTITGAFAWTLGKTISAHTVSLSHPRIRPGSLPPGPSI